MDFVELKITEIKLCLVIKIVQFWSRMLGELSVKTHHAKFSGFICAFVQKLFGRIPNTSVNHSVPNWQGHAIIKGVTPSRRHHILILLLFDTTLRQTNVILDSKLRSVCTGIDRSVQFDQGNVMPVPIVIMEKNHPSFCIVGVCARCYYYKMQDDPLPLE